jgi:putative tricarboxylic transport membrane protein
MKMRGDTIAAVVLFILFAAYGLQATQIQVFPGQELEPFKPRTMPFALAAAGVLLAALRVLQTLRSSSAPAISWRTYDWTRASLLCVMMVAYGLAFTALGFVAATSLFLAGSFYILGERRLLALLIVPLVFTLAFWAVMTRLLGLYLSPGLWLPG